MYSIGKHCLHTRYSHKKGPQIIVCIRCLLTSVFLETESKASFCDICACAATQYFTNYKTFSILRSDHITMFTLKLKQINHFFRNKQSEKNTST